MLVVATGDFEVYHDAVAQLRERGAAFTTIEPDDDLPPETRAVVVAPGDEVDVPPDVARIVARPGRVRQAVEEALAGLRTGGGRTIVGVDPGDQPGIAVLSGDVVVGAFQVPLADAGDAIRAEIEDAVDPLVRVGDGARLAGARIVEDLPELRVELVDETGTTPYLGPGARGMGDVLAAVNIARLDGEVVEERTIEPTAGELQVIKDRSRERSPNDSAITETLARNVATGELSLDEAIDRHERDRNGREGEEEKEESEEGKEESEEDE